ncbi:MAG: PepSY domain-containing protein [Bacteroidales bacterium]|nr:PepSY domain-containing protein [Bacteroidales bacterium]
MIRFFKKYHKWLGVIFAIIILSYVFSGIILNHRETLSFIDVSRKLLPKEYRYQNWNNAAVKSTLKITADSILIYGNIGIWLTDSSFSHFSKFSSGFPKGIDNRKIFQIIRATRNRLLAGTFSGLYTFSYKEKKWVYVCLPVKEKNIADIIQKQDTIFVLTRSFLLKTTDLKSFVVAQLPPPENYDNKAGLFKTLWVIHSGEIYGTAGKIIVDFAGLIFAFLTITGFIVFVNRIVLKKNIKPEVVKVKLKKSNRWNIKWHNKFGWIALAILILNTTTGMFLRPPLLAFIGNSRVGKIPFTELATPNPWFDQLRRIFYDKEIDRFIIVTMDGLYYSDDNFKTELKQYLFQPPASVMGVTVFEKIDSYKYLVGSFEGLFVWNSQSGEVIDYVKKQPYVTPTSLGKPIGDYLVSGFTRDFKNQEYFFDYDKGATNINGAERFPDLPRKVIDDSPISLWNVALEIHTGRIYQSLIGDFYVLIVPLMGMIVLFILISGFIVWLKITNKVDY